MEIAIEKRIRPMAYPTITINELKTHLKKIKKNKATGPDNIKGELIHCTTEKRHMHQKTTRHITEHTR